MSSQKSRLSDVAREAGVSKAAASLALRGKTGISEDTREKVKKAAERLGYVADTAASLLGKHRAGAKGRTKLCVAFLGHLHPAELELFLQTCSTLGVDGRNFQPSEFASPGAASRILWQQGISGLIVDEVSLWPDGDWESFDWSKFSIVKLSRGKRRLPCNLVRHSAFDYMVMALQETVARGYRKLAVLLERSVAEQDDMARLGALLAYQTMKMPSGVKCSWRQVQVTWGDPPRNQFDAETVQWLRKEQPDAIVAYHWVMVYALRDAGFRFPGPIGLSAVLASAQRLPNTPWVAGCDPSFQQWWAKALAILLEQIGRGERGFSPRPAEHVIEPVWIEGETLPDRSF